MVPEQKPDVSLTLGESWQKQVHQLLPADSEVVAGVRRMFVNAFLLRSILCL